MTRAQARLRVVIAAVAGVAACASLALIAQRVDAHERGELELEGDAHSLAQLAHAEGATPVSARLARVKLERGESALFELCADDRLEAERWKNSFELVVFGLPKLTLMLRVPLDAAHLAEVRRNAEGACLTLGGGVIERAGMYSVDAVWPRARPAEALMQVPLRARVLARRPLSAADHNPQLALAASLLALLTVLIAGANGNDPKSESESESGSESESDSESESESGSESGSESESGSDSARSGSALSSLKLRASLAALTTLLAVYVTTRVPTAGALATLGKGAILIVVQCGVPLAFMGFVRGAGDSLPIRPRGSLLRAYALALAAALALWGCAKLALLFVPATSEAPIQTFVAWPSGMLCFAALGLLLPIGEELFFRGLLYHALLLVGRTPLGAGALSWTLFVLLHAQQSWGNWGGLVSIAAAGVVLTGLRIASGSVLVPALAHVLYNFALSAGAF